MTIPGHLSATYIICSNCSLVVPQIWAAEKQVRGEMGINAWLVSGTKRGIELTQKKCLSFFYQKAEETFNPLFS